MSQSDCESRYGPLNLLASGTRHANLTTVAASSLFKRYCELVSETESMMSAENAAALNMPLSTLVSHQDR